MALFSKYYPTLSKHEGGYANNPADKGGETYKGIARNYHPNWVGWARVDAHVRSFGGHVANNTRFNDTELDVMVYSFFETGFWKKYAFGLINNQSIAEILADWSINGGFYGSLVKELQAMVGTVPDGYWGKNSSAALNKFASNRVKETEVFSKIKELRKRTYLASSNFNVFGAGWLRRLDSFSLVFSKRNALVIGGVAFLLVVSVLVYNRNKEDDELVVG